MTVWVWEHDGAGVGVTLMGVFSTQEAAKDAAYVQLTHDPRDTPGWTSRPGGVVVFDYTEWVTPFELDEVKAR